MKPVITEGIFSFGIERSFMQIFVEIDEFFFFTDVLKRFS